MAKASGGFSIERYIHDEIDYAFEFYLSRSLFLALSDYFFLFRLKSLRILPSASSTAINLFSAVSRVTM